jgi:cytochrome c oxidase subunit 3
MILGGVFLFGQVYAWRQMISAGIAFSTSASSSFFYIFIAAHAVCLSAGLVGLLRVAFGRKRELFFTSAVSATSIYWHSMDVLWIVVLLFLIWNS